MADKLDVDVLRQKLQERYRDDPRALELVEQSVEYVFKKSIEKKLDKNTGKWELAYNLTTGKMYTFITECIANGFGLDGINYVISGNNMYMPTYHAFKNKIYQNYPETVLDIQLVRNGDEISFAKESGSIVYSHSLADPFNETEADIKGAYCVIKNSRGEFLETLNKTDYQKMQDSSKSPYTWKKWPSEFWKKSVIKRACKTHFHDITEQIDSQDNEAIGLKELVSASDEDKQSIIEAKKAEANEN